MLKWIVLAIYCMTTCAIFAAQGRISINSGTVQVVNIGVLLSDERKNGHHTLNDQLRNVISTDLENCGLFKSIIREALPQKMKEIETRGISFATWRARNIPFVVTGRILQSPSDRLKIEFQLYDVISGSRVLSEIVEGNLKDWRRLAHAISDLIYQKYTGEIGFFNTSIIYTQPRGFGKEASSKLVMMDYDGYNPRTLVADKDKSLNGSPRFSPRDRSKIVFLKIANKKVALYVYNLKDGRNKRLTYINGMSFAPRYTPDGEHVVMSLEIHGRTAIYIMALGSLGEGFKLTRLTDHVSIDTSPCFSPDGSQIVFTSDRDSSHIEHLFLMNADGSNVQRLSFGRAKYSQPVWSPRGNLIAFIKQVGMEFYLGVMAPDGTGERMISKGYLIEQPCWAPNGRYIMYTQQDSINKPPYLVMVDITGHMRRVINTPAVGTMGAKDAAWSPLIVNTGQE